jgi:hypothetical protein
LPCLSYKLFIQYMGKEDRIMAEVSPKAAKKAPVKPKANRPSASGSKTASPAHTAKKSSANKTAGAAKAAVGQTLWEDKPPKPKKARLVRDSFTMPELEYAAIAAIKKRCLASGIAAKKSEVLRAAISGLAKLGDEELAAAIQRLDKIKTGRPAKGG